MKKIIISVCFFFSASGLLMAQSRAAKSSPRRNQATGRNTAKAIKKDRVDSSTTKIYSLSSTSYHDATINRPVSSTHYEISDPTIRALNERAKGSNIKINKSGIVGVSKGTYGYVNGHITFYTTSTPTSGTITGSGSVGTGSSLGSMGTNESVPGVNGKSPYAGTWMWGTPVSTPGVRTNDSVMRKGSVKRN